MPEAPLPDFVVYVDVYHAEVAVFLEADEMRAWLSARGMHEDADSVFGVRGCAHYVVDPEGCTWFLLYVPPDVGGGVLAHEAVHLAWFILEVAGVKVKASNHEALAYLVQHLFSAVWARLHPAEPAEVA